MRVALVLYLASETLGIWRLNYDGMNYSTVKIKPNAVPPTLEYRKSDVVVPATLERTRDKSLSTNIVNQAKIPSFMDVWRACLRFEYL